MEIRKMNWEFEDDYDKAREPSKEDYITELESLLMIPKDRISKNGRALIKELRDDIPSDEYDSLLAKYGYQLRPWSKFNRYVDRGFEGVKPHYKLIKKNGTN